MFDYFLLHDKVDQKSSVFITVVGNAMIQSFHMILDRSAGEARWFAAWGKSLVILHFI
jgi:hypothetical protein